MSSSTPDQQEDAPLLRAGVAAGTSTTTDSPNMIEAPSTTNKKTMKKNNNLTIGIFGGSFNPIHLGHALLAITTQQTKQVDEVVLVPVYKHAVKHDLLPFEDRVAMCRLAIEKFNCNGCISVSTIEEETKVSNGTMIRALKSKYPIGTKFVYICGDDFIRWMDRPKGIETLKEVHGLIVQRRLHKQEVVHDDNEDDNDNNNTNTNLRFFKEPLDIVKIRRMALELNLHVDFIHGELPHFSSTLVRNAPGHWKSFLTSSVVKYLNDRPHLLQQLLITLNADVERETTEALVKKEKEKGIATIQKTKKATRKFVSKEEKNTSSSSSTTTTSNTNFPPLLQEQLTHSAGIILQGLEAVHALQLERGVTGLYLSIGGTDIITKLHQMQTSTDDVLTPPSSSSPLPSSSHQVSKDNGGKDGISSSVSQPPQKKFKQTTNDTDDIATATPSASISYPEYEFEEVNALNAEIQRIPIWLKSDRRVLLNQGNIVRTQQGSEGWLARLDLIEKFHSRIDVLIGTTVRAMTEILTIATRYKHHQKQQQQQQHQSTATTTNNNTSSIVVPVDRTVPELLFKWCEGKEALGRLRAFVCSGGPTVPYMIRQSLPLRERLNSHIATKERRLARVLSYQQQQQTNKTSASIPDALHVLLEKVTEQEWILMGCFSTATPLSRMHHILKEKGTGTGTGSMISSPPQFNVEEFFESSSEAIDFLLSFSKALTASALASA